MGTKQFIAGSLAALIMMSCAPIAVAEQPENGNETGGSVIVETMTPDQNLSAAQNTDQVTLDPQSTPALTVLTDNSQANADPPKVEVNSQDDGEKTDTSTTQIDITLSRSEDPAAAPSNSNTETIGASEDAETSSQDDFVFAPDVDETKLDINADTSGKALEDSTSTSANDLLSMLQSAAKTQAENEVARQAAYSEWEAEIENEENIILNITDRTRRTMSWEGRPDASTESLSAYLALPEDTRLGRDMASVMVDIVKDEVELSQIDGVNVEFPENSNNIKYNTWFYGEEVYGEEYGWNASFIAWCAAQAGFLRTGTFPDTAELQELYSYLVQHNHFSVSSLEQGCFGEVKSGDIYFHLKEDGSPEYAGYVMAADPSSISIAIGDQENTVGIEVFRKREIEGTNERCQFVHVVYPSVQQMIFVFCTKDMGLPKSAACGIMANIRFESSFSPAAREANGIGYGLVQWSFGRRTNLESWCNEMGYLPSEFNAQMIFMDEEFNRHFVKVLEELYSASEDIDGAREAAETVCYRYEAPANTEAQAHLRADYAASLYPCYENWDVS